MIKKYNHTTVSVLELTNTLVAECSQRKFLSNILDFRKVLEKHLLTFGIFTTDKVQFLKKNLVHFFYQQQQGH